MFIYLLRKTGKRADEKQEKKIPAHGKSFNSRLMQFSGKVLSFHAIKEWG